jgi:hypothetical protein
MSTESCGWLPPFHGSTEVSLPVNGSVERLGTNVYPSWPRDAQREPTILQSIEAEVRRMGRHNVFLKGAGPAKHVRPVSPGEPKMSAATKARMAEARTRWTERGEVYAAAGTATLPEA